MRLRLYIPAAVVFLLVLWMPLSIALLRGSTWLELTDAETGREIVAQSLREGEEIVLTWKNSLFGLMVTEVFAARGGRLELTKVTFADPRGGEPPAARPVELDDLYQTGGPFKVEGLSRPVSRLIFRVGEIGDPRLRIGENLIQMARQVHFGGAVQLVARRPSLWDAGGIRELRGFLRDVLRGRY